MPTWPVNGITEILARQACRNFLMGTAVGTQCSGLVGVNFDGTIDDCVLDVKVKSILILITKLRKRMNMMKHNRFTAYNLNTK